MLADWIMSICPLYSSLSTGTVAFTGAAAFTAAVAVFPVHQFSLNLTFHLIEAVELVRFEDGGELIDILHPDGLGLLLTFDAGFGDGCGLLGRTGAGFGLLPLPDDSAHFIVVSLVDGDEGFFLLVSEVEMVHEFPDLCVEVALVHGFTLFLAEDGQGGKAYQKGDQKSFHEGGDLKVYVSIQFRNIVNGPVHDHRRLLIAEGS